MTTTTTETTTCSHPRKGWTWTKDEGTWAICGPARCGRSCAADPGPGTWVDVERRNGTASTERLADVRRYVHRDGVCYAICTPES